MDADSPYHASLDPRYARLPADLVPVTECLKDVVGRMLPYWYDALVPDLRAGQTVLVARPRQLACGRWSSTSTASPTTTSSN